MYLLYVLGYTLLKILIILGVLRLLVYLIVLRIYIGFYINSKFLGIYIGYIGSLTSIQYFTIVQITFI